MSKKYKPISTLEYYNFRETNQMAPVFARPYKVKVSDKDGNIITIEKDDALYACVSLAFDKDTGVLSLLDVAHENSVLAEIEMPNADYIYNCRYDEELNAILFDVKSLYGSNTNTIEIDVDDLVELYEAGQGIEIGEKSEETGRKPISIKLAEGENLLKLSESGLSISDDVATDEEISAAISGKADIDYVNDLVSGITDDIEHIYDILGTDEDDPNLDERIDSKADLDEFNDLEDEVGEIEKDFNELSGKVESLEDAISGISSITETVEELSGDVESLSAKVDTISAKVEDNEVTVVKITSGLPENVREAYVVINKLGEQLGDRIDIYYDSTIVSIDYLPEEQIIRYVYINSKGEEITVDIDLSKIVIESEFADGLQVNDGVVSVKIDPTSDSYLTVSGEGIKLSGIFDFFQQLLEVNSQQWAAISGETSRAQEVEGQLWTAINNEAAERKSADSSLNDRINEVEENLDEEARIRQEADDNLANAITAEKDRAIARENEIEAGIDAKVNAEKTRAEAAEQALSGAINTEKEQRERADNALSGAIDDERSERRNADIALSDRITNLDNRIVCFETNLSAETAARIQRDEELSDDIAEIQRTYVTKDYVDAQDRQVYNDAVYSAVTSSNQYTDNAIDEVENELKEYSDEGDTELQQAISTNTTKINAISNLKGVIGDDTSNYDDTGNGILDVLHREFHEYVDEHGDGDIKSITYEDGKLIIIYESREGEKRVEIPIEDIVDLEDYYKKEETDALLDEKLDASAYTDISEQVSANTYNIEALSGDVVSLDSVLAGLIEKLGYRDNDTLITNGEHEVAFGEYNISNTSEEASGETIFSIGNGTDENNRSNAVEVKKNGDLYLWVEGEFMNVNKLLGQIAHEVYDNDTAHNSNFFDGD